jgi:hypothetical protein
VTGTTDHTTPHRRGETPPGGDTSEVLEPSRDATESPDVPEPPSSSLPSYRVDYVISADAFIDASRLAQAPMRTRLLLLCAVVAVAGLVMLVLAPTGPGLMLVLFAVILTLLTVARAPERWVVRRQAGDVIGGPVRLVIGPEGISVATPTAEGRIAWSALSEVREDDRTVIFLRGRFLASYAPAEAFGSPARRAEIVAFARRRIGASRTYA